MNWSRKKKERERKNAVKRGHYGLPATPKGSAHTALRPILPGTQVNYLQDYKKLMSLKYKRNINRDECAEFLGQKKRESLKSNALVKLFT